LNSDNLTKAEIINRATDFAPVSGVYFLIRSGEIRYIGMSSHVRRRIIQHQNDGRVFDAYSIIKCEPGEAVRLEKHYIRKFDPAENIEHRYDSITRKSHKKNVSP